MTSYGDDAVSEGDEGDGSAVWLDLTALLDAVLPYGQRLFEHRGRLDPFAGLVHADGKAVLMPPGSGRDGASAGMTARTTAEVLGELYGRARALAGDLRAAAFLSEVILTAPEPGTAVRVEVEHREGLVVEILLRYHRESADRATIDRVSYGPVEATVGTRRIWPTR
jgi:hypothetical protein